MYVLDLCGAEAYLLNHEDVQELKSPYYPGQYPPNLLCIWTISATAGGFPTVRFLDISLHHSQDVLWIHYRGSDVLALRGESTVASVTANGTSLSIELDTWKHTYHNKRGVWLEVHWSQPNGKLNPF